MIVTFYIAALVAVCSTFLAITRRSAVHALLYLVVSLLSIALIFLLLGAPFVAALEVIIYAGAIMVLFIFVIMTLAMGSKTRGGQDDNFSGPAWIGPAFLAAILMIELIYVAAGAPIQQDQVVQIPPKAVAVALLGPYLLGVELASLLLLSALVGAYHLAYHLGLRRPGGEEKSEVLE